MKKRKIERKKMKKKRRRKQSGGNLLHLSSCHVGTPCVLTCESMKVTYEVTHKGHLLCI